MSLIWIALSLLFHMEYLHIFKDLDKMFCFLSKYNGSSREADYCIWDIVFSYQLWLFIASFSLYITESRGIFIPFLGL